MDPRTVVVTRHSAAPIEAVWALLSHAETWKEWGTFTVARLEREGVPAPDGVGAIRNFGFPMYTSREEVVAFDPPTHLAYTLLSGIPLRDYRSDVTLTSTPSGTDIEWRSSFRPPWPASGWFWTGFMRTLLRGFTRRLARAAAQG